jgi:tetratricopeptide (TPR) repeat protein
MSQALDAVLAEVEAAIRAGELPRAMARADAALSAGLEHPLLLNLHAHALEQQGRHAEALGALERAQALAPADPQVANARGLCLAALGRPAEAAAAFDLAARSAPRFAPAHFNKGWSSELAGDLDVAAEAYGRALELAPGHAEAAAALAHLAARRGQAEAARRHASQALALRPGLMKAILALVQVEIAAGDFTAAETRLREAIAVHAPSQSPEHHAMAVGLLADCLDGQGRHGEAFAAYEAEHAMLRRLHQAQFAGPGVQTVPDYLAWTRAWFEQADPAVWRARPAAPPSPSAGHVFMIGFPRSGTTLLETVLAGAPEVATLEEREFLAPGVRELMSSPQALERLAQAGEAELEPLRESYWAGVRGQGIEVSGKVFIDKLPFNTFKLPLIAKLFPEARILFSVRDPRDVVLSCFRRRFALNPAMFEFLSLEGTARLYDSTLCLFELYRDRLGIDPLMLRYEDIVEDFEASLRRACGFLGVEWRPELAAFAERARARGIATPSATQVARGLYRGGIGQWRAYRSEMAPVLPTLAPWVEAFGYPEG